MKPLVYIAGPYTHPDPVINVHTAVAWGEEVERLGCTPFIPHLSMLWHLVSPADVDRWYERDLELLEHCDALVRFPGASVGADREVEQAREVGLPVFDAHDEEQTGPGNPLADWIASLGMFSLGTAVVP